MCVFVYFYVVSRFSMCGMRTLEFEMVLRIGNLDFFIRKIGICRNFGTGFDFL